MSRLLMLTTLQAAAYGPAPPTPDATVADKSLAGKGCEQAAFNEIVVCKKSNAVTNQALPALSPSTDQRLILDERGLFRLKLGKNSELTGGPEGAAGVTFHIHF